MRMDYMFQQPRKWTFEQQQLKKWIEEKCGDHVLNLFAGKTRLKVKETRVDWYNNFDPDFRMDAYEFVEFAIQCGFKYDTIILDPPTQYKRFNDILDIINRIVENKGNVITIGNRTSIMGRKRGYHKTDVLVVNHGGNNPDTLVVVEKKEKTPQTLPEKELYEKKIRKEIDNCLIELSHQKRIKEIYTHDFHRKADFNNACAKISRVNHTLEVLHRLLR